MCLSRRARATIEEAKARDQTTEEALAAKAAQEEQRKKESHDMVADSIRRELAESELRDYSQMGTYCSY